MSIFNDAATTEIYTLSLHDALPIFGFLCGLYHLAVNGENLDAVITTHAERAAHVQIADAPGRDRKSTRLNSSHANLSYAVFCLTNSRTPSYMRPRAGPPRLDPVTWR